MEIITGYTGKAHIFSEQDRDVNIGIVGEGSYVLQTGMQLEAEVSSNNEIKIRDGVLMHQGCTASIKKNTYDSLTIINGSQGMKRIDLIVARYERNQDNGVESIGLKVIQGTPAESNPAVPSHITGDIQSGDAVADMPMYKIIIDGLNITEVQKIFSEAPNIAELNRKLPVFKRRNSSEAGICTPHYIMIMGTLVLQGANADYRQLFSASDLLSKILKFYDPSISNFDEGKCVITTNNGDGNAAAIHFYAPEWWGSNNAYFQYFYPATSGQIRVNYCIHYLKL
ncbi:hypothetical protein DEGADCKI_01563 [[Clostridium] scindens]|nr:hypothetical protein DEGADCKI_01563 [[Clostridium] scindens]